MLSFFSSYMFYMCSQY